MPHFQWKILLRGFGGQIKIQCSKKITNHPQSVRTRPSRGLEGQAMPATLSALLPCILKPFIQFKKVVLLWVFFF